MKKLVAALAVLALASPALADGAAVYAAKCKACHGADGKGVPAMVKAMGVKDLTVSKLTDAQMADVATKGQGKMKAVAGLSADDAKAVAKYVKGGLK